MSGGIHRRLESLEEQLRARRPGPSAEARTRRPGPSNAEARERMRAALEELADAKREGRPPSREALAVGEALSRRLAELRGEGVTT